MMLVPAFLRANWRVLAVIGAIIFGVLLLTQATDYGRALLTRYHLRKKQAQATAASTRQQNASTARYTDYRLDSVRAATERVEMLRQALKLQQHDDSLTRTRPARVPLPAFESLPRE